ncbi:MAG TPA: phospholipase D-like domain-containing protein [Flavitalea sp.]|nr:phospholipase D-like domain-containing protein [Flavitalea sp.]
MARRKAAPEQGFTENNKVQLIRGGVDYFNKLEEIIDGATETIHLQTYIYDADETGNRINNALIRAAGRGVKVFVLIDGYASKDFPKEKIQELRDGGVHFRWFEPLIRSSDFYFGRRLHHKVTVVDSRFSLVGGINISDKYNDTPGKPAWLDWCLLTEGETSIELCRICVEMFEKSNWSERKKKIPAPEQEKFSFPEKCRVRVRRNDWVRRFRQISRSYNELFRTAEKEIMIMCSYFLPGPEFCKSLQRAARRGVKIKVIIAGTSDVKVAKYAERHMYRWYFRNKIEIYEYQKTILHAKIAVADNNWVTVGSYNVNNISAYASIELNLEVKSEPLAQEVKSHFEEIIANDCMRITEEKFKPENLMRQLFHRSAYEVVRVMFYVSTFYFKQRKT